jgi:hypothetical protein
MSVTRKSAKKVHLMILGMSSDITQYLINKNDNEWSCTIVGDRIMAEEFLNKLNGIEDNISKLDETLKRMVTLLAEVTEVKSEVRQAKDEIIDAIKAIPQPEASGSQSLSIDEVGNIVRAQIEGLQAMIGEMFQALSSDVIATVKSLPQAPAPAAAAAPAPAPTPAPTPAPESTAAPVAATSSLPPDKAMKIAARLDAIIKSMKMGCKAGDVLEVMSDSKNEITKIVPSDPIMIKLDSWMGLVGGYQKRKELSARDILKIKKDIKEEIPKYRPA